MSPAEISIIVGFTVNLMATIGAYVKLRISIEHRLTVLETHIHNQLAGRV